MASPIAPLGARRGAHGAMLLRWGVQWGMGMVHMSEQTTGGAGGGYVYLACPFRHANAAVRHARVVLCEHVAALYVDHGRLVYAPLVHRWHVDNHLGTDGDRAAYWRRHGLAMLERCDELVVLDIPGTEAARGVAGELAWWAAHRTTEPTRMRPLERFLAQPLARAWAPAVVGVVVRDAGPAGGPYGMGPGVAVAAGAARRDGAAAMIAVTTS